ncbi:hypothetical protein [Streptomyces sp. NPDC018031]|uniref:hypothetical protein n=1 Tax=Streptomyces sp. NPDC018031 TaxID=3365033 RepID=UPI0037ACAE59
MIRQTDPVVIARVAADVTRLHFRSSTGTSQLVSLPDAVARELAFDLGQLLGLRIHPRQAQPAIRGREAAPCLPARAVVDGDHPSRE